MSQLLKYEITSALNPFPWGCFHYFHFPPWMSLFISHWKQRNSDMFYYPSATTTTCSLQHIDLSFFSLPFLLYLTVVWDECKQHTSLSLPEGVLHYESGIKHSQVHITNGLADLISISAQIPSYRWRLAADPVQCCLLYIHCFKSNISFCFHAGKYASSYKLCNDFMWD